MGYLNADKKQELFANYGKSNTDTGSPESQVALFSYRINHLTAHLKKNKKDFGTQRSLLRLVGKRRQLLEYLKKVDIERYRAIVKALELRNGAALRGSFILFLRRFSRRWPVRVEGAHNQRSNRTLRELK